MSPRTVRLLYVEDDALQQRLIAHHLKALPEYAFAIKFVASEQLAMECFKNAQFDLVLLDYHLAQGDGLHLLGRMREFDPIVPIIAISGMATSEVAAKLAQAGADDYFDKRNLNSADLATSIRSSLRRAEAVRKKLANRMTNNLCQFTDQMSELCANYVRRMDVDFLERLEVTAHHLKHARISARELQQMYESATSRLEVPIGLDQARTKLLTRPLLCELLIRVYDDPNLSAQ